MVCRSLVPAREGWSLSTAAHLPRIRFGVCINPTGKQPSSLCTPGTVRPFPCLLEEEIAEKEPVCLLYRGLLPLNQPVMMLNSHGTPCSRVGLLRLADSCIIFLFTFCMSHTMDCSWGVVPGNGQLRNVAERLARQPTGISTGNVPSFRCLKHEFITHC